MSFETRTSGDTPTGPIRPIGDFEDHVQDLGDVLAELVQGDRERYIDFAQRVVDRLAEEEWVLAPSNRTVVRRATEQYEQAIKDLARVLQIRMRTPASGNQLILAVNKEWTPVNSTVWNALIMAGVTPS